MDQDFTQIDTLIAKVLANEASENEMQELEQWRVKSPENQAYYVQTEQIWSKMQVADLRTDIQVDTEVALRKVKDQINQKSQPSLTVTHRKYWYGLVGAIACFVAAIWLLNPEESKPIEIYSSETIKTDTLNDGSLVTLNSGSALFVDSKFGKKERRVRLQGEAYFQVAPDAQKSYIITTPDLEVRVIGTAFNVRYNAEKRETSVEVFEGKVMVSNGGLTRYLEKGQAILYKATDHTITDSKTSENTIAYKTGKFVFDNAPLSSALAEIGIGYNVSFQIDNPDLRNCPLTARLERKSLEGLLEVLSETYGCTAKRIGDQIILTGGACE